MNEATNKGNAGSKSKANTPSPRQAGPATMQKTGSAGPGGGKPIKGGNTPKSVTPAKVVKVGKPAMTKAPSTGPTTSANKTGTVKKK